MKTLTTIIALSTHVYQSNAHFAFGHLLVNGTETGLWKHILEVAGEGDPRTNSGFPPDVHFPQIVPQYEFNNENVTCGRAAFNSLTKTTVADVVAGEEIGFRTMNTEEINSGDMWGWVSHLGPAQAWLSRAPSDDLTSYRGDGDWFKVGYVGPRSNSEWMLYGNDGVRHSDFNFSLPKTTPAGKYLLRAEFIYPTSFANQSQWFINCALVNVISTPGTVPGTPAGFAKHPGTYKWDDPGILIPLNQDVGRVPDEQMRLWDYQPPGGPVWMG